MASEVGSRAVFPAPLVVWVGRALALESNSPETQTWLHHFAASWPQESFNPPEPQSPPPHTL